MALLLARDHQPASGQVAVMAGDHTIRRVLSGVPRDFLAGLRFLCFPFFFPHSPRMPSSLYRSVINPLRYTFRNQRQA
jgi:hypothetical protein